MYHLNNFLPPWFSIESIVISSKFKSELEQLFRIRRGTISRHTIYGVKNLTAVTANVLLMKTSPIQIVRSDISTNFACPLLVYLYCLQMLTYLSQYNNTVYNHVHIYNSVCSNNLSLSCRCVSIYTTAQHHSTPQHNAVHKTQQITLTSVLYLDILKSE